MSDFRPEPPAQRRNVRGPAGAMAGAAILIATPLISYNEGMILVARPDALAVDHVITFCRGAIDRTGAVKAGDKFTLADCNTRQAKDILRHVDAMIPCIKRDISAKTEAAMIDFGYNLGVAAFCNSTLVRLWNAGNETGAAREILRWTWSGGKDCRTARKANGQLLCAGIPKRRDQEYALFTEGLN